MIRTGIGFDVHRFSRDGKPLVLGGIQIPHSQKVSAHSDGDILLHALSDALLGAAALGDIGYWFPNDEAHKDMTGSLLYQKTLALIEKENYRLNNLDAVIIAMAPKVAPFVAEMRQNIANLSKIDLNCVSVKATTTDYLGCIGREEGIAVMANVLIEKCD